MYQKPPNKSNYRNGDGGLEDSSGE